MRCYLIALSAACLFGAAYAARVELWWNISYAFANPDQLHLRRVIGVNGSWPPPIVEVDQGDELIIHAYNGLGNVGTALHSHGIYFNGTNHFDGAVFVTQCPIPPGETLTYEIPTDLQSGSYWIHGHHLGQYIDGLRTPFIINPVNDTREYDEEYWIVMADWYHVERDPLMDQYLSPFNPDGAEPVPDSAVVYVAHNGRYMHSNSDISSGIGVSSGTNVGAVLNFQAGKSYRLRLLNMAAFAMFHFSIDGHNMSVIELDGDMTEPLEVSNIEISAAQRVSVLVKARDDISQNWPIQINMESSMLDDIPDELVLNVTVAIVYSENNELAEPSNWEEYPVWWDTDLVPVEVLANAPADVSYDLHVWFEVYDDGTNRGSYKHFMFCVDTTVEIDHTKHSTYRAPLVPSIFSQLTMGNNSRLPAVYGAQTHAVVLNHLDNVELVVYNWHTDSHPFHLHGHKFQVVQLSQNATSDDPTINPPLVEDQPNPARRDTITIPAGGFVRIRFRADNPGTWFFHCHMEWHVDVGLAVTFIEAPTQSQFRIKVPQHLLDHCRIQGIPTSGNVVGKNSTTNFTGQPWGPFPVQPKIDWTSQPINTLSGWGWPIAAALALAAVVSMIWHNMQAFNRRGKEQDEECEELMKQDHRAKEVTLRLA